MAEPGEHVAEAVKVQGLGFRASGFGFEVTIQVQGLGFGEHVAKAVNLRTGLVAFKPFRLYRTLRYL